MSHVRNSRTVGAAHALSMGRNSIEAEIEAEGERFRCLNGTLQTSLDGVAK